MPNLLFKNITLMISDMMDQVGLDDTQHGKRVAFMATQCARYVSFEHFDQVDIFTAALLHDIGVSCSQEHELLVTILDWEKAQTHCLDGAVRMKSLPFYAPYADAIYYHHTHWQTLADEQQVSQDSKSLANLIFLVDRVDALLFQYLQQNPDDEAIHARNTIQQNIQSLPGYFAPELVEAFLKASAVDAFWFQLDAAHIPRYMNSQTLDRSIELSPQDVEAVAFILAAAIDAKSPFTAEHSTLVGELAYFLAQQFGLPDSRCQQLKLAGYLHDIGKLHIPDSILEKEGPLTEKETIAMRRHGFEARDILQQVEHFSEIADWACHHHEFLDGSGYPYQLTAEQIPTETRILTIADIFQALAQKRPYRDSMTQQQVISVLDKLGAEGKVDTIILELVHQHANACWQLANGISAQSPIKSDAIQAK